MEDGFDDRISVATRANQRPSCFFLQLYNIMKPHFWGNLGDETKGLALGHLYDFLHQMFHILQLNSWIGGEWHYLSSVILQYLATAEPIPLLRGKGLDSRPSHTTCMQETQINPSLMGFIVLCSCLSIQRQISKHCFCWSVLRCLIIFALSISLTERDFGQGAALHLSRTSWLASHVAQNFFSKQPSNLNNSGFHVSIEHTRD